MCIIAIKPKGVQFPSEEILENMWYSNPHGAGMMWAEKGRVKISKGYMDFESFIDGVDDLKEKLDVVDTPIVLHFRLATHGGIKPENCHPFPITGNIGVLQKLMCTTDVGVVHNGIISITPRAGISDTMEYILTQISVMKSINRRFAENSGFLKLVENAIGTDKMCFLDCRGKISTVGNFVEDNGMLYSNTGYKTLSYWSYLPDYDSVLVCDIYDMEAYVELGSDEYMNFGVFYADRDNTVYVYSPEDDGLIEVPGAKLYSLHGDKKVEFNAKYSIKMPLCDFDYFGTTAYDDMKEPDELD